jgi:hypothetical protein
MRFDSTLGKFKTFKTVSFPEKLTIKSQMLNVDTRDVKYTLKAISSLMFKSNRSGQNSIKPMSFSLLKPKRTLLVNLYHQSESCAFASVRLQESFQFTSSFDVAVVSSQYLGA